MTDNILWLDMAEGADIVRCELCHEPATRIHHIYPKEQKAEPEWTIRFACPIHRPVHEYHHWTRSSYPIDTWADSKDLDDEVKAHIRYRIGQQRILNPKDFPKRKPPRGQD